MVVMNDRQVGRVFRALRIRRGLRQVDVARRARVDPDAVSLLDRGELEHLSVAMLRRLWAALGVDVEIEPRLPPAERARLLDAGHAALVERALRIYRAHGWETLVELTFNNFGERGSVDLVAWHPTHRALSLNEVKTRLPDIQELHATFGRKARIVPALLKKERGWLARSVGRVLIVADATINRETVAAHAGTFASSFPGRTVQVRRWLGAPIDGLAAIWYLRYPDGARSYQTRGRVRRPKGV